MLGKPAPDVWPDVVALPEWERVQTKFSGYALADGPNGPSVHLLAPVAYAFPTAWGRLPHTTPEAGLQRAVPGLQPDTSAFDLLARMVRLGRQTESGGSLFDRAYVACVRCWHCVAVLRHPRKGSLLKTRSIIPTSRRARCRTSSAHPRLHATLRIIH